MRIGIFGGSFDPVHKEHIRFAESAIRCLGLDKLFIMPAHTPPHKAGKILSSNEARLAMCRLAFQKVERAEVCDYEIAKGGTSYTYLTCQHFKETYKEAEIFFLVGTDMLRDFPTWRKPEEILKNATLAVCGRSDEDGWWEQEQTTFIARFGKPFARVNYNGTDVSSTKIRVLAGAGMRLTEFLTDEVAEYVEEKGLYAIPFAKEALALEKEERRAHSLRVAYLAAKRAVSLKMSERAAVTASLFHDCGKNLPKDSPLLDGFVLEKDWGDVPAPVLHQFTGAYLAEKRFGVTDGEVLNAIRFHTSGRANMGELEKLIFLADMLEEGRNYDGVEDLRKLFWQGQGLDECLKEALFRSISFLKEKKADIYPLTQEAYEFYKNK
ncbi:MAG: nicotinate (nicotinamide) nucleotide adenylyltransferase [Clostridia bacterium]|nr:nicotinate (nicotinamide) nucleotide adenylyltransferase [Clostridia bacterium]